MSTQVQDDGFHEIQLNGKQLVFLFMAATVVSVVIFLCGVLVGRGVRAERASADVAAAQTVADPTPQQQTAPTPPAGSDPTTVAPPTPAEDLTYFSRLEKPNAPKEELKPAEPPHKQESVAAVPKPQAEPAATRAAAPPPPPPAPKPEPERAAALESASSDGFAVQIAALNVRSEADAIARRLTSKGYAAYVVAPASGTPSVYRVRIGKFPTRREAESIAARLQKEEQYKPWITR